jgi:hypothetical protein
MTVTATPASASILTSRPAPVQQESRWWGVSLYFGCTALYFGIACLLGLRYNLFDPDAASRVANAGFVFMSRYPHLSAIGFVWNPLPSLIEIPFMWLSPLWPPLKTHSLAGPAQSALLMAGAVMMVRGIALDRGVGRWWRWLAVAGFALHPVIITYGQSGLSESGELVCLLWAIRYLLRWLDEGSIKDLTFAGIAMAGGYLSRYEFVIATAGAAALVGLVTLIRNPAGSRFTSAMISAVVLIMPIAVTFIIWAIAGWVLADELFAQLSSRYGNAAQVANALAHQGGVKPAYTAWPSIGGKLFTMQPLVVIAAGIAVFWALVRRRFDLLVPLVVIGPILLFAAYGQHKPTTFGFFRFYITAIPLVTCISLVCWTPRSPSKDTAKPPARWDMQRITGMTLIFLSVFVATPVTAANMLDRKIGDPQLQYALSSVLFPDRFTTKEIWFRRVNANEAQLAKFFDDQHLPPGSVLMDTANTWGIWLKSKDTKQFVITSDYDFTNALNRPYDRGVKYIVVSSPQNYNEDAISTRYPSLWATGAGFAVPILSVAGPEGKDGYRVYEVIKPAEPARR